MEGYFSEMLLPCAPVERNRGNLPISRGFTPGCILTDFQPVGRFPKISAEHVPSDRASFYLPFWGKIEGGGKKAKCHKKRQKTSKVSQRILRPFLEGISTRVDKSVILTSRAITGSPEAFNGVRLFCEK